MQRALGVEEVVVHGVGVAQVAGEVAHLVLHEAVFLVLEVQIRRDGQAAATSVALVGVQAEGVLVAGVVVVLELAR